MRAALLAALAVCAPTPGPAEAPEAEAEAEAEPAPASGWLLPGTSWRLVELGDAPFAGQATATLTEDGRIVGQAPCNRFSARYEGRWPDIRFRPAAATRMACPELALEAAFFAALAQVDHAVLGPDGLTLTGPGGARLRFVRL